MKSVISIFIIFSFSILSAQNFEVIENIRIESIDVQLIRKDSIQQLFGSKPIVKIGRVFDDEYTVLKINGNSFWFNENDVLTRIEIGDQGNLLSIENHHLKIGDSLTNMIKEYPKSINGIESNIQYLLFDIADSDPKSFVEIEYRGQNNAVTKITYYTYL